MKKKTAALPHRLIPAAALMLAAAGAPPADAYPQAAADMPPIPTTLHSALRPVRSGSDGFVSGASAESQRPPSPASVILVPEHLDRDLTRFYIERNLSPNGRAWLAAVIRNGHTFIPFVREEIDRRGLPPELVFVPFIESDYVGSAVSRSGAAGIWQFMLNSIAPFGLRVTADLDERRDFRRATVAALTKLEEHREAFGCWALALAAYNMGPNGLRRSIQRAGTNDYWELAARGEIPRETANFVPRIVAAAYVLSNSRRFAVDWWPTGMAWEAVVPGRPVSLAMLAAESGTDANALRRLNMELTHGITPADPAREIVVPAARAQAVRDVLAREGVALIRHHRVVIRPGDTLYAIARHYGIPLATLQLHNPATRGRHLRPGEAVIVPLTRDDQAAVPYTPAASPARSFDGTHVVVAGDTLWSLARLHGVNPQDLAAANGMGLNQVLSVGRVLRVPSAAH